MIINEFLQKFGAFFVVPIVRNIFGWLENALEDGEISEFEVRQLLQTLIRMGLWEVCIYFGLNSAKVNIDVLSASIVAFIIDRIYTLLKKKISLYTS